jgi:hypothetical protein
MHVADGIDWFYRSRRVRWMVDLQRVFKGILEMKDIEAILDRKGAPIIRQLVKYRVRTSGCMVTSKLIYYPATGLLEEVVDLESPK